MRKMCHRRGGRRSVLAGAGAVGSLAVAAWGQVSSVTIIRDTAGVPHVYGSTLREVIYGAGYAQAQDRLWQMDVVRRLATGTLAELLGPGDDADGSGVGDNIESDIQTRTLFGPVSLRAQDLAGAPAEVCEMYAAFGAGINAWIEQATATGQLPPEYYGLGAMPREWSNDDAVAVQTLINFNFGSDGGFGELTTAIQYLDVLTRLGPDEGGRVYADTHVLDDPSATTTVPDDGMAAFAIARRSAAPVVFRGTPAAAAAAMARHGAFRRLAARHGFGEGQHSNAVAIGPALSATGRALLLGGPQTGHTTPQSFMEMGVTGAGLDVTGAVLPGLPLPAIGVANGHAWTLTSGTSDTMDIFAEFINPANPGQYLYDGAFRDFDCRVEVINVAGGGSLEVVCCRTVHGPVLGAADGLAFTVRGGTDGRNCASASVLLGFARARSIGEFQQVVLGGVANFNVTYADDQGNIAYWHAGAIPVRAPGFDPWLPKPGVGIAEWQGFVPAAELPNAINPAQGYLINWNNKPAAGWENSTAGFGTFGPAQRVDTLRNLVSGLAPGTVTLATLAEVNRLAGLTACTPTDDAHHVPASSAMGAAIAAVDPGADARLPQVLAILESWNRLAMDTNGDGAYDRPGVTIFNAWWGNLLEAFEDELGAGTDRSVLDNLALRQLQGNSAAVPLLADYLDGTSTTLWATTALVSAIDELTVAAGSSLPQNWLSPLVFIHWDAIGAIAAPDTPWQNRGTYNQIVELGRGGNLLAENVVAPGQSGNPLSPHFADQLGNYATWTYKPMWLRRGEVVRNAESVTRLRVE